MAALLTSYGSLPCFGTTAFAELVSTTAAGRPCALEDLARLLRQHVIAADVDRHRLAPHLLRRRAWRRRRIDRRRVDHDVEAAEGQHGAVQSPRGCSRGCQGSTATASTISADETLSRLRWPRPARPSQVQIGDDDVRAALRQLQGHFPADAAAAADDERDLAAEFPLGRHALQLGLFERPVFDSERFEPRQRHVVVEAGEVRWPARARFACGSVSGASSSPSSAFAPAIT